MLNKVLLAALLACCGLGCTPTARFTMATCASEFEADESESIHFRASVETANLDQQQLLYEVAVLDGRERPVRSETGRYKDLTGQLKAARTVMVLGAPWTFDNLDISMPVVELDAVQRQKPAFAEFRMRTPEGVVLASRRVPLPGAYAANIPATEPPAPARETTVASARRPAPTRAAPEPDETAASASERKPASRSGSESREIVRATPPPANTRSRSTARPAEPTLESERTKPARKGEPPPLRPVGGTGRVPGETPPRPTATTKKPAESRERVMAGAKDNQTSRPTGATTRPATSQPAPRGKAPVSQPASQPSKPTKDSEIDRNQTGEPSKTRKSAESKPASQPRDEP